MRFIMLSVLLLLFFGTQIHAGGHNSTSFAIELEGFEIVKAAVRGDVEEVRRLVDGNADVNEMNVLGNTALIEASMKGFDGIVELLLQAHADVNQKGENGYNALMWAARNGHIKTIERLLQVPGIHVLANVNHQTALDLAGLYQRKKPQVIELIRAFINQKYQNKTWEGSKLVQ